MKTSGRNDSLMEAKLRYGDLEKGLEQDSGGTMAGQVGNSHYYFNYKCEVLITFCHTDLYHPNS